MLNHSLIKRIERSLHLSTLEGMAYGAVQGSGEHFVSAYAVALGATNIQLGLLTSIPSLLGALAQSASVRLVALMGSRKRVVLLFAALSAFMWLPIMGVGYLLPNHGSLWLIAFFALYVVCGMVAAELFHIMLGGRAAHRPAHYGRMHLSLHGHREPEDAEAAEHPEFLT